jgi:hypothetical protein
LPSSADLPLLLAVLAVVPPPFTGCFETLRIDRPADLVDLEIDAQGTIFLLHSGLPHLAVIPADGQASWFDLDPVTLPGGFCLDGSWGGYVSDAIGGMTYRFDDSWLAMDSVETPGRPGDLCLYGLSIIFVSRETGAVTAVDGDGTPMLRLDGPGAGWLSASGGIAVYSDGEESYLFSPAEIPARLASGVGWAAAGGSTIFLSGDSLFLQGASVVLDGVFPSARLSCSPDGRTIAVWTPGGGEVLVSR